MVSVWSNKSTPVKWSDNFYAEIHVHVGTGKPNICGQQTTGKPWPCRSKQMSLVTAACQA